MFTGGRILSYHKYFFIEINGLSQLSFCLPKMFQEKYVVTLNVENNGLRQMPLPSVEVADRKKSSPADSHEILHQQPTLPPSKLFNVPNMK